MGRLLPSMGENSKTVHEKNEVGDSAGGCGCPQRRAHSIYLAFRQDYVFSVRRASLAAEQVPCATTFQMGETEALYWRHDMRVVSFIGPGFVNRVYPDDNVLTLLVLKVVLSGTFVLKTVDYFTLRLAAGGVVRGVWLGPAARGVRLRPAVSNQPYGWEVSSCSDENRRKLDSPELRPLPPLSAGLGDGEDKELYSPGGSTTD
ncbi:hypothetical protein LguiB_018345 [Lonicera macranthoides]